MITAARMLRTRATFVLAKREDIQKIITPKTPLTMSFRSVFQKETDSSFLSAKKTNKRENTAI
jgi:hypothetical protein